jgi:hypothetical protein
MKLYEWDFAPNCRRVQAGKRGAISRAQSTLLATRGIASGERFRTATQQRDIPNGGK